MTERQRKERLSKLLGKPGRAYPIFCGCLAVLMLFFLSSGWWFPDLSSTFSSPVGQQQKSSADVSLTLLKWQYNPSTEYSEAWFSVEDTGNNPRLDFSVSARAAVAKYDASVLWWEDGVLAVSVSFPPREKIRLSITDNVSQLQSGADTTTTSSATKTAAEFKAASDELPHNVYLSSQGRELQIEAMEILLLSAAQAIPQAEEQIQSAQQSIQNLEEDIRLLREEQEYQTQEELKQSESAIAGKESQILSLEDEILQLQKQQEAGREKLVLLLKKMQDSGMEAGSDSGKN